MNQGARDANAESARRAAASREETQVTLLREIRDLLKLLVDKGTG